VSGAKLKRRIGRREHSRQAGERLRAVARWPDQPKPETMPGELLTLLLTRPRALAPTSGVAP
jgi:hypothetical protein